jgi:4-diphosphocytidyl-2-C-methyl-D-erythritol kinase
MRAIAGELGADVPGCLARRPLQVSGIGERLRPAPDLPPAWLVLVNPGVPVLTADVFRRFDGGFGAAMPLDTAPADAVALAEALHARRNDLETSAIALAPEIADVLAALGGEAGVLLARMTGSGATCFGLAATAAAADAAASRIKAAHPAWWVAAAPMLAS